MNDQSHGTWGIDLFIGQPLLVSKGIGSTVVTKFTAQLFTRPHIIKIITNPAATNIVAIRCFEKAGFIKCGQRQTPEGLIELMAITPLQP